MSADGPRVKVFIDGGARGNPGPAGAGVIVRKVPGGRVLRELGFYLGRATNNVAEYRALLAGLEAAGELHAAEVEILSDSELLVRQMNGEYRVRNENLQPLFEQAQQLARTFRRFAIRHIRRQDNPDADRLVNQAINLRQDVAGA